MTDCILYTLCAAAGLCFGSFAGVLAYRVPRGIGFVRGRSRCPVCGVTLRPSDLIPIVSFVIRRGRCGRCAASISSRYLVLEILSGLLACLSLWRYGPCPAAVSCFLCLFMSLVISAIDAESMTIPNQLTAALAVTVCAHAALTWPQARLFSRAYGLVVLAAPMLMAVFIKKDAFGGGDIKIAAVYGFLLGLPLSLLAGFAAVVLGGFAGVFLKLVRRSKAKHMAFGPYLCAGFALSLIWGESVVCWYLSLLTF